MAPKNRFPVGSKHPQPEHKQAYFPLHTAPDRSIRRLPAGQTPLKSPVLKTKGPGQAGKLSTGSALTGSLPKHMTEHSHLPLRVRSRFLDREGILTGYLIRSYRWRDSGLREPGHAGSVHTLPGPDRNPALFGNAKGKQRPGSWHRPGFFSPSRPCGNAGMADACISEGLPPEPERD